LAQFSAAYGIWHISMAFGTILYQMAFGTIYCRKCYLVEKIFIETINA
jgi:hypothetical protein